MATTLIPVTDASFEADVLASELPVLVDFWAEWCGPCKRMAPMLADLASEYASLLTVVQLDIDANRESATAYGVMSIPTLKVFRAGQVVHTIVGAKTRATLLDELRPHVELPAD